MTKAGDLAPQVRAVVAAGLAITVAGLIAGPRGVWDWNDGFLDVDPFMFRNGLALGVGGALALVMIPASEVSRWIRLAIALPVAQVAAMLVAWYVWRGVATAPRDATTVPIGLALAATVGAIAVASALIAPRREAVHAAVMLSLSSLLLIGLWLPLGATTRLMYDDVRSLVTHAVLPPFAVAVGFTAFALRRPRDAQAGRATLITGLGILLLMGLAARSHPTTNAALIYAHFAPVIGACAIAVLLALGALAAQIAIQRARHARALRRGTTATIAPDGEGPRSIATYEVTSWLRGLRTRVHPFVAVTAGGDRAVPSSARLAVAVPLATTALETGGSVTLLARGESIVLGGYVHETVGDDPFRRAEVAVPGPGGAVVGAPARFDGGLTEIALHLWRPCVAYLVIAAAVALPALVTAL